MHIANLSSGPILFSSVDLSAVQGPLSKEDCAEGSESPIHRQSYSLDRLRRYGQPNNQGECETEFK